MPHDTELAHIEVTAAHSPLAFIYEFFKPTIEIDQTTYKRSWGTHQFDVTAGSHEVSVSYPWIFSSECGKASVTLVLQPGDTRKVKYVAGLIRYLPGKITVE